MTKRLFEVALSLGAVAGLLTNAIAAVLEVPGEYPDIRSALAVAESGDTVLVAEGEYYFSSYLFVPAGVTLRSTEGRDSTLIHIENSWGIGLEPTEAGPPTTCSGFRIWVSDPNGGIVVILGHRAVVEGCELIKSGAPMGNAGPFAWMADESIVRRCFIGSGAANPENMFWTWEDPATLLIEDCEITGLAIQAGFFGVTPGSRLQFRNNTFFDAQVAISLEIGGTEMGETDIAVEFTDNIFFRCFLIRDPDAALPDKIRFRHNVYWDCYFAGIPGVPGDPEDFFVGGFGNFEADPLFCEDPLTHWLEPESPCIGAGETGENIGARLGVCDVTSIPDTPVAGFDCRNVHVRPNPSTGSVEIVLANDFDGTDIDATILGVDGRRLTTISYGAQAGSMVWDGEVDGKAAPNGSYIVVLQKRGTVVAKARFVLSR